MGLRGLPIPDECNEFNKISLAKYCEENDLELCRSCNEQLKKKNQIVCEECHNGID